MAKRAPPVPAEHHRNTIKHRSGDGTFKRPPNLTGDGLSNDPSPGTGQRGQSRKQPGGGLGGGCEDAGQPEYGEEELD